MVESFDRIPFSMPSCEGISLDKIVDVQKFRPFVVKGVTKPPFVFPKFNYREWQRMMMRLQNHVSPETQFVSNRFDSSCIYLNMVVKLNVARSSFVIHFLAYSPRVSFYFPYPINQQLIHKFPSKFIRNDLIYIFRAILLRFRSFADIRQLTGFRKKNSRSVRPRKRRRRRRRRRSSIDPWFRM